MPDEAKPPQSIAAVDLFCGAGGLSHGLAQAGVDVVAGVDIDSSAKFSFEENSDARFVECDVGSLRAQRVKRWLRGDRIRLVAGCAPCQPFSKYTNGQDRHDKWGMLETFGQLLVDVKPELVTMENVSELATRGSAVFESFTNTLEDLDYNVDWKVVDCADYGVPQHRKRLVLVASTLGRISVPKPTHTHRWRSVRHVIGRLPVLASGEQDEHDPIHVAAKLSDTNLKRIRATPLDGGTRKAWPKELVPECYKRASGRKYTTVYGRMRWDEPAPTMTTLCNGLGNGRFGHPEQDRAISLREAALLQSFPNDYKFWPPDTPVVKKTVARLIGNAVPPRLGLVLGRALTKHANAYART